MSFWTSMTEPATHTRLVFYINGHRVYLMVTELRWALFMGHVPHETCSANEGPVSEEPAPRVHHSSFWKPGVEHLAGHILSNLPCSVEKDGIWRDWCLSDVHRLRAPAFEDANMQPVFRKGAQDAAETLADLWDSDDEDDYADDLGGDDDKDDDEDDDDVEPHKRRRTL